MSNNGRVLVADDEPELLRTYQRVLSSIGYEVETAENGRDAAQLIEQREYDLILSDIQMPGMSGLDLLRTVRDRDGDLPFIVLTGSANGKNALEAVDERASRYLTKPIEIGALREAVVNAVELGRVIRAQRASDQRAALPPVDDLAAHFDHALETLAVVVHDQEVHIETAEPWLPTHEALLDAARELGSVHRLGRAIRQRVAASLDPCEDSDVIVPMNPEDLLDEQLFLAEAPLALFADRVVFQITATIDGAEAVLQTLKARGYRVSTSR